MSAANGTASMVEQVQDTAYWVAMARALESERKDALFADPLARRLAGEKGAALVRSLSGGRGGTWPIVARTHIVDRLVEEAVEDGVDCVVNLAAGLDTRPYRLRLPAALSWIEVDHADVIAAKEDRLREETPRCRLERVALDLSRTAERRALLEGLRDRSRRAVVLTEGLLYYLSKDAAMDLARDLLLARPLRWIADIHNQAVLDYVAARTGGALRGTAAMQFAADEGPVVFEPLGWRTRSATSIFKTAGKLKRLPFPMSLFARLPERPYGTPGRPWTGVCVLEPAA